jgi:hypothetical protein
MERVTLHCIRERIGVAAAKSMDGSKSKITGSRTVRNVMHGSGMNIIEGKQVCGVHKFMFGLWLVSIGKGYGHSGSTRLSCIVSEYVCYGYKKTNFCLLSF